VKTLSTLAEALQFGLDCEAQARFADAARVYQRLLELGVTGSLKGESASVIVYKSLIRCLARSDMAQAIAAFERLMPLLDKPRDTAFDRIYLRGLQRTQSYPLPVKRIYRHLELSRLLRATRALEGAVAECGCFRGLSSYILLSHLQLDHPGHAGAGFHVFDSFAGLSEPGAEDTPPEDGSAEGERIRAMCRPGYFSATLGEVRAALAEFPQVKFHPGWIPHSFDAQPERHYRFVHVDVDLYAPTLACFEYFWPRLVDGGAMVCDDYGWPGGRRAVDQFAQARRLRVTTNEHRQAVLHKSD